MATGTGKQQRLDSGHKWGFRLKFYYTSLKDLKVTRKDEERATAMDKCRRPWPDCHMMYL